MSCQLPHSMICRLLMMYQLQRSFHKYLCRVNHEDLIMAISKCCFRHLQNSASKKLQQVSSQTEIITSQIQVTHSTTESKSFFISQTEGGIQNLTYKYI